MGQIRTTLTLSRWDRDGRLIGKTEQPSRSWTKHFFDLLYEPIGWASNNLAAINDISVAGRILQATPATRFEPNLALSSPGGGMLAFLYVTGGGVVSYNDSNPIPGDQLGIVVGSNNTAPTPTDDKLNTRIAHGLTAGTQLIYGGTEVWGFSAVNPNASFFIRRYLTNNSGADVTVREVGIYGPGAVTGTGVYSFCICRDSTIDTVLHDTNILSVVYTVQVTV